MKKIQISTVKKECAVQVINLDCSFVAQAIRAGDTAEELKEFIDGIVPMKDVLDKDGLPVLKNYMDPADQETVKEETVKEPDWNEFTLCMSGPQAKTMYEKILRFAAELRDAILEGE